MRSATVRAATQPGERHSQESGGCLQDDYAADQLPAVPEGAGPVVVGEAGVPELPATPPGPVVRPTGESATLARGWRYCGPPLQMTLLFVSRGSDQVLGGVMVLVRVR